MGMFSNVSRSGLEESGDRLGGFNIFKTGIYSGVIKMAYAGAVPSGAKFVDFTFTLDGQEYNERVFYTAGTAKGGNHFYYAKDDKEQKKKIMLPGFTTVDDICLCATGKALEEQDTDEKMVKVYDPDTRQQVNKAMPVLVDLIGQPISLGIRENLENKSVKEGNEYVPIAEERQTNSIEKAFNTESKLTVAEAKAGKEEGAFWTAWLEKNLGKVNDRRKIKDGGSAGTAGRPRAANAGPPMANGAMQAGAAKKSLFGAKAS